MKIRWRRDRCDECKITMPETSVQRVELANGITFELCQRHARDLRWNLGGQAPEGD